MLSKCALTVRSAIFNERNAARWYEHEEAWQRYDYTYSEGELREWVPKLHQLDEAAPLTLVYFNNHLGVTKVS